VEEIKKELEEIVLEQLKDLKNKKEVPSTPLLDTINTLIKINYYQ